MKIKTALLIPILFLFAAASLTAQPVTGFWGITKVEVGDREMTPVARWTRIETDGTYRSGNGWQQNSVGNWSFDEEAGLFHPVEKDWIVDDFGPFTVVFEGKDAMRWSRTEDGMEVKVTLNRIEELPMSVADRLKGLWDLDSASREGADITTRFDPEDKYYLLIRWDRVYIERSADGERTSGIWHMDSHRPHLSLLSHVEGVDARNWRASVSGDELRLTAMSDADKGIELVFRRINRFPG